jgi:tetratricopeptide (TPR) repeat protein
MRTLVFAILMVCATAVHASATQILAGSAEDKAFQKIQAESNAEAKLQGLLGFERQFPQSKALSSVYLMMIEYYRQKDDRERVIEYGEKVLRLDDKNVTAMMVLSRNYAIERRNVDRAVELAQKAVELIGQMRSLPPPTSQTDAQWKAYLDNTEGAARSILSYAMNIKGR